MTFLLTIYFLNLMAMDVITIFRKDENGQWREIAHNPFSPFYDMEEVRGISLVEYKAIVTDQEEYEKLHEIVQVEV